MHALTSGRSMMATLLVVGFALAGIGRADAAAAQTIVSLGFDDGYSSQYDAARPMLAAHGMHATFFIISGSVGESGYMTWSQLDGLAADGNEIGGHTLDHPDLTTLSSTEARRQICDDRTQLQAHGFQVTDFAYPYGAFNAAVEKLARDCGYSSARTTLWYGADCPNPCTQSLPPQDPFATTVVGFSDQTLPALEQVVRNAEAAGGWAQIVIHQVCDDRTVCAISPATLNALLDWLASRVAAGAIAVETVHDVISGPPPPPPLPQTSITAGPAAVTNHPSPSFSFASDAQSGVTFACRLDGPGTATGSWSGCTSPKAYTSLPDGSYTFSVRASNAAGTDPTPASRSFTIDATAPAAPVIGSPAEGSWNASGTVVLSGSAEANSTVEVFDGVASRGTTSASGSGSWSKVLSGVPDGSRAFTATASDAAGNTSGASAPRTVKVDTAAPETLVAAGPSGTTPQTSAAFAFAGYPDAVSFECALDGAPFAACSSPVALSSLASGPHSFAVRATDAAGNRDATPVTRTWSVDPSWAGPVTTSGQATAGGTVSSIPSGGEATSADPVASAVTTPVAGPVSITTSAAADMPPGGYVFLGEQLQISAPQATASDPLILTFRLDGSLLPAGALPADSAVFRNGTLVPDCTGAGAIPDPCVASRTLDGNDLVLVVRTSRASTWNLGRRTPQPAGTPHGQPADTTSAQPSGTTLPAPIDVPRVQPPGAMPTHGRCVVPKLRAHTLTAARRQLTRAHCRLGTVGRKRHRGRADIVLAQGRRAGLILPAGTRINLTVSRRPRSGRR